MATKIYINTDLKDLTANAVANKNRPTQVVRLPQIVEGETLDVELSLVNSNGGYDSRSGDATVSLAVAVSARGAAATSGTFTLTASTETTAPLAWNASAEAVEGALNALNSGSGAYGSKVDVKKLNSGSYRIIFKDVGARTDFGGTSIDLAPESEVTIATAVVGSSTIRAQMIIEISQQPAIYTSTWTTGSSKFSGQLNANTARVQELIATGQDAFFEVKADDDVICQVPIAVLPAVAAPNSLPAHTLPSNLNDFANDPSTNGNFNASNWLTDLGSPENYAVWGQITGTLTNQSDLVSALALKGSASDVAINTAKVGITSSQSSAITSNTANIATNTADISTNTSAISGKQDTLTFGIANTNAVKIDNTGTWAHSGDICKFASSGIMPYTFASLKYDLGIPVNVAAIALNTAKVGITTAQAADITTNNAKVGITTAQANEITANTSKVEYPFTTDFISGVQQTRDLTTILQTSGYYNSNLSSIYIGSNVTSIGSLAFQYCGLLTGVNMSNSVTSIGDSAFRSCSALTSVTIADSVTSLGSKAFYYCQVLTSVTLSSNITSIGSNAFYYCSTLPSITIPDSVTSIGERSFSKCFALTSITIPSGVTSIGSNAFYYSPSLSTLNCLATAAPTLGSNAFYYTAGLSEIHVPVGSTGYGATYGGLTVVADL